MTLKDPPLPSATHKKRATVHDVARLAGVAIGTVSRVINGAPSVSEEIRARVNSAIKELDWTPNTAAQSMRGISARMIGFIFSDIRNPLYSSMVKGAEDTLSKKGYMLVVASSDGKSSREVALTSLFSRRRADGLLLTVEEESDPDMLRAIKTARFPIVTIERELALPIDRVNADHFNGTYQATRYLLSLGHRRIALITGSKTSRVARDRLQGFLQAHTDAGVAHDPKLLRLDSYASDYGFRQTQILLGMNKRPTAIMSAGMHLLSGVLEAIRMKGLDIPSDISLITSNDTELARLATPSISVIRYDPYALGREAALQLLHRIGQGSAQHPPMRIEIPTEFILRESCAPPKNTYQKQ